MPSDTSNLPLNTNLVFSTDWFGQCLQAEETVRIQSHCLTVDLTVIVQALDITDIVSILVQ
jgi:hypothetical protein